MGSNTTNYSLYKPSEGETGWASNMNSNFDTIDTTLASINGSIGNRDYFHNRIINSNFGVKSRYISGSSSVSDGSEVYVADRWYMTPTGASASFEVITDVLAVRQNYARITGNTSITNIKFGQRIEAANAFDMAGSDITLSLHMSNTLLNDVTWTLKCADSKDDFSSTTPFASGIWNNVGEFFNSFSATAEVPNEVGFTGVNGIELELSVGEQTGGRWQLSNVQLERGSTATDYSIPNISDDCRRCAYYFRRIAHLTAYATSSTAVNAWGTMEPMRSLIPTASTTGPLHIQGGSIGTSTQSASDIGTSYTRRGGIYIMGIGNFSGLTPGGIGTIAVPGNNGNYITFDAELYS